MDISTFVSITKWEAGLFFLSLVTGGFACYLFSCMQNPFDLFLRLFFHRLYCQHMSIMPVQIVPDAVFTEIGCQCDCSMHETENGTVLLLFQRNRGLEL